MDKSILNKFIKISPINYVKISSLADKVGVIIFQDDLSVYFNKFAKNEFNIRKELPKTDLLSFTKLPDMQSIFDENDLTASLFMDLELNDIKYLARFFLKKTTHKGKDYIILFFFHHHQFERMLTEEEGFVRFIQNQQNTLQQISDELLCEDLGDIDNRLNSALKLIGLTYGVDRVYVINYHDVTLMSRTHEWLNPAIKPFYEEIKNFPLDKFSWLYDQLENGKFIYINNINDLPDEAYAEKQDMIKNNVSKRLFIPLISNDHRQGILGFDYLRDNILITLPEFNFFLIIGNIISSVLNQQRNLQILQNSEKKFKSIIDFAPITIAIYRDGIIEYANKIALETFGFDTDDEIIGTKIIERIHPDYIPFVIDRVNKVMQGIEVENFVREKMLKKDGSSIDVEVSTMRIDTVEGPANLVFMKDLSKEEALKREFTFTEQKYMNLVELSPDIILVVRPDYVIEFVNQKGVEMLEYDSKEELIGSKALRLVSDENMGYVLQWFITDDKRLDKPKYGKIVTKHGKEIDVELMVSTLIFDNFVSYLVIIRDHSDRLETERELIEREAKYRRLFEDSSDALYISSHDGKLLDYNQTFKKLFELPDEHGDIMVTRFYQDVGERDIFIERVLEKGSIRDHELNLITYKGKEIICVITTNVRYDNDGKISQLEGLLRDITAQKMQEKSLLSAQKLESLGLISSGIAHYFNNALMGILGSSSLLEKIVPDDKDVKSLLDIIKHSSNKVSLLVKQLLSYSGESTILNIGKYNISKVIESSLTLLEISVDGNVNLQTNLVDYTSMVEIDKQKLEQVLLNLVHNASEAIDHNDGEVIISTFFTEMNPELISEKYFVDHVIPGNYGCVSVMDNGSGIATDKLDRIFDPFYTTKFKGRGLGLAAVRGIVKSLKGHISVETVMGEGSIFTIYLPIVTEN